MTIEEVGEFLGGMLCFFHFTLLLLIFNPRKNKTLPKRLPLKPCLNLYISPRQPQGPGFLPPIHRRVPASLDIAGGGAGVVPPSPLPIPHTSRAGR